MSAPSISCPSCRATILRVGGTLPSTCPRCDAPLGGGSIATSRPAGTPPAVGTGAFTTDETRLADSGALSAGDRVGRYQIVRQIGRGGMGVVYEGIDPALGRRVAIKRILATAHLRAEHLVRFQREATAMGRLHHPAIVSVFASGTQDDTPYIVMDFVEGESYQTVLERGLPAVKDAIAVVRSLADGVAHAHAHGVIHRDIKPDNVMIGAADGAPRLLDFGLARDVEMNLALTATGMMLGTPAYMAPEQAAGEIHALGPACDVWALGAIIFRAVCGRTPFAEPTPIAIAAKLLTAEVPAPSRFRAELAPELETVILKCLRREAADRYPSAAALRDDLDRILAGQAPEATPRRPTSPTTRAGRRGPRAAPADRAAPVGAADAAGAAMPRRWVGASVIGICFPLVALIGAAPVLLLRAEPALPRETSGGAASRPADGSDAGPDVEADDGAHPEAADAGPGAGDDPVASAPPPDTTAPEIVVDAPAAGAIVPGSVRVAGTIADNGAIRGLTVGGREVAVAEDGGFALDVPLPAGRADGPWSVSIEATDATGNVARRTCEMVVDRVPPVVTLEEPAREADPIVIRDDEVVVAGRVEDAHATVVIVAGAEVPLADGAFRTTVSLATDGEHRIEVTAADAAGHVSEPAVLVVARDTTGPTLEVESPAAGATREASVALRVRATDPHGPVEVTVRGGDGPLRLERGDDGAFDGQVPLAEGAGPLQLRAVDALGNGTTRALAFLRDATPPVVSIDAQRTPSLVSGPDGEVDVFGEVDEPCLEVTVAGVVAITSGTSFHATIELKRPRAHAVEVVATDRAGNVGRTTVEIRWRRTAAPLIPAEVPGVVSIEDIDVSADGKLLAVVGQQKGRGGIEVYSLRTGKLLRRWDRAGQAVKLLPDGRHLVSGRSHPTTAFVLSITNGEEVRKVSFKSAYFGQLALDPGGRSFVYGDKYSRLEIVDLRTWERRPLIGGGAGHAFHPTENVLFTGAHDTGSGKGGLFSHDLDGSGEAVTWGDASTPGHILAVDPTGRFLAAADRRGGRSELWSIAERRMLAPLQAGGGHAGELVWRPVADGPPILASTRGTGAVSLDIVERNGPRRIQLGVHEGVPNAPVALAWVPGGRYLISGNGTTLRLWDVKGLR